MKRLLIVISALVIGVAIALIARYDPGYVRIAVRGTTIETTLLVFLVLAAVAFAVLYVIIRAFVATRRVPRHVRAWSAERRIVKSHQLLARGMLDLVEGRWKEAEQLLTRQADRSDTPLLNYLAAAQAAQQQGATDRADTYLKKAQHRGNASDLAVEIAAAELQLKNGDYERALTTLKRLHAAAPKNPKIIALLLQAHVDLKNWEHLVELVPAARKYHVIDENRIRQLEVAAWSELLAGAARDRQPKPVQDVWSRMPKSLHDDETLLHAYASQLIACHADEEAIALLRKALNRKWSDTLVYLYGIADGGAAVLPQQLRNAEEWLRNHPTNPVLLLTLGRLALRNNQIDKARGYLEGSIAAGARPETYQDLGALLERLGEKTAAMTCYQKGLALLTDARRAPRLPATRDAGAPPALASH